MAVVVGGLLSVCLLYCLVAPNVYEANARIALRATPATALSLNGADGGTSGAFASGQIQLETLANVFRSDQLAWRVITRQQLYRAPAFMGNFARRFPQFDPNAPSPDAQAFLLDRFHRRLTVQTLPPPPGKPTENVSKPDKAVSASNASGREPKLIAPEKRIDFGKQPQDKNLVRAIAIRNGGSADLKIESIVPS